MRGDGDDAVSGCGPAVMDPRMGRARVAVAAMMMQLRTAMMAREAGCGDGEGARPPAGGARAPVHLVELGLERGDGRRERLTPLGYRTAVALPRVLADLPVMDGRRMAALRYQHLVETIAASPCGALVSVRVDGGGRINDGGAVWRAGLAEEVACMRAAIGSGIALSSLRGRAGRRTITDRMLVDQIVLGGQDLRAVLRAQGWSTGGKLGTRLSVSLLGALERMAAVAFVTP